MISVLLCGFKGCFCFLHLLFANRSFLSGSGKGCSECQGEPQKTPPVICEIRRSWERQEHPFPNPQEQVNGTNWGPCLDLSIKCHLIGKWANKIPSTGPQSTVRSFAGKCASSCVSSVPGRFRDCYFLFSSLPHPQVTFFSRGANCLNLKMTSSSNKSSSKSSSLQVIMSLPPVPICHPAAGAP